MTRMRLLVTRPEEDAGPLIAVLEAQGHQVLHAPMLTIRYLHDAVIPARDWAGLVFTSANGVRALLGHGIFSSVRHLPVFTVGEASATEARAAGFAEVTSADGDVTALASLIAKHHAPERRPILHVAGSVIAGDLAGDLGQRGFEVHRAVLYGSERVVGLPEPVTAAFKAGTLHGALFFSPRTAIAFREAVLKAGVQDALATVTGFCLSDAVARALEGLSFDRVLVASRPEQASLLSLIGD